MRVRIVTLTLVAALCSGAAFGEVGSLQSYGVGTAGSGGIVPSLWASGTLHPGNPAFELRLEDALGGSSAFLLAGLSPLDQPLNGFQLLVNPFLVVGPIPLGGTPGVPGDGFLTLSVSIPANPAIVGVETFIQCAVNDLAAGPFHLAATRGLKTIGTDAPMLIGVDSTSAVPDPVIVIDPATGAQADWGPFLGVNGVHDVHFAPDGRHAVLSAGSTIVLFEVANTPSTATGPPVKIQANATINSLAITPDGRRCYALQTGQTSGAIFEIDIDPTSPTYATAVGVVGNLPAGFDGLEGIAISADGEMLAAANLGLGGGPAAVLCVDIREGSPTKNQMQTLTYLSGFVLDVELAPDHSKAFASVFTLAGCGQDKLQVIDTTSGVVDATLTLGCFPSDIDVGPRGRYAYIASANAAEVLKVGVDPGEADYLQVVASGALPGGSYTFGLTLSPDGETAYVGEIGKGMIFVVDTATMQHVQTLSLSSGSAGVSLTAR